MHVFFSGVADEESFQLEMRGFLQELSCPNKQLTASLSSYSARLQLVGEVSSVGLYRVITAGVYIPIISLEPCVLLLVVHQAWVQSCTMLYSIQSATRLHTLCVCRSILRINAQCSS